MNYNFDAVIKTFYRMCNKYDYACDINECPIAVLINEWEQEKDKKWDYSCLEFAQENPKKFAECVMTWGVVNPAPIYPTIGEVLQKICELMNINPRTSINTIWDERLNTEAADYFGINPINKEVLTK